MKLAISALLLLCVSPLQAQKLSVKVVDRQDHDTDYSYVVPEHSFTNSNASATCSGQNCFASGNSATTTTPSEAVPFHVRGTTFSLLLPDGRVAVVNCDSKFAEHFAGPRGNHRSCKAPITDNIQADFHGDSAKLIWVVSLDGKKTDSETYKVLGILDKPKS